MILACPPDDGRLTSAPAGFLRWLHREHGFDAERLCDVVEKPWKWTQEHAAWLLWLSAGRRQA